MKIPILYEDEYVLALDKPSGLLVHGDGKNGESTLVNWINENYPELKTVGEPLNFIQSKKKKQKDGERFTMSAIERPGIIHRLDKETSGVILVAKTQEAHRFLKKQFQNRKVEKIYNAVVWGNFSPDKMEGTINKPIGRSSGDFRKWSAEYGAKGELREAVTEYKVLAQKKVEKSGYTHHSRSSKIRVKDGFAYLEIKPKTGRTHQIRVHLKSISHPVVCDKLYGNKKECNPETCLSFNRLALHALSIKFQLPNETFIKVESPLPKEFENAKNLLEKS